MRDSNKTYLFHDFDGHSLQEHTKQNLKKAISDLREAELKGTSLEDWIKFYEQEYSLDVPVINREGITYQSNEVKLDARNFHSRIHYGYSDEPVLVNGNSFVFHIPFTGDPELFKCSGNKIMHNSIHAQILTNELLISYTLIDHDADKLNQSVEKDIGMIEGFLRDLTGQFAQFNGSISGIVQSNLEQRLEKFKKDEELKSKLKFPMQKRNGISETYAVPNIRKKVTVVKPKATSSNVSPEPTLDEGEYNNILRIMQNMALVMEKSPLAFKDIKEEDLRQHFLMQLNGQYEGNATGETFNLGGKTDILIKHEGKNIFIAECKFWTGAKTIHETIDQLLDYTSWRDTKTSIVLFNKNKNLSAVLGQIPALVSSHVQYEKTLKSELGIETEFRYLFKSKSDKERKLFLTILVFDVPT